MEIGTPTDQPAIIIEPLEDPVPREEPKPVPAEPEKAPELVPA